MKKFYDKLVRDKIPRIIEEDGKSCIYSAVEGAALVNYANKKLREEVEEFIEAVIEVEESHSALIYSFVVKLPSTSITYKTVPEATLTATVAFAPDVTPTIRWPAVNL